jgi:hypothetical protein
MTWFTAEPAGADNALLIDLYYSNDSGQSWGLIKKDAPNNDIYIWRVSLLLENNTYWVPSDTARIKAVAHYADGQICGWDMSDEDYCPPIEYDLLTPEELAWLTAHNLLDEDSDTPPDPPADVAGKPENGFPDETVYSDADNIAAPQKLNSPSAAVSDEPADADVVQAEIMEIINQDNSPYLVPPPLTLDTDEQPSTSDKAIIGEIFETAKNNPLELPAQSIISSLEILPVTNEISDIGKNNMDAIGQSPEAEFFSTNDLPSEDLIDQPVVDLTEEVATPTSREIEIIINDEPILIEVTESQSD